MSIRHAASNLLRSLYRSCSKEFRATTDLFDHECSAKVPWKSGAGPVIATLHGLALSLKPQVIVEIGTARGMGACALALACRKNRRGKTYTIDPHTLNAWSEADPSGNNYDFFLDRLKEYDLQNWCEPVRMTSAEAAKSWTKPIDLLFIDGDHTYEGVRRDFELFLPFLSPKALVLIHDSMWEYLKATEHYRQDIGVPKYMAELRAQGYESVTLPCMPGLTIVQPVIGGFPFAPAESPAPWPFVE